MYKLKFDTGQVVTFDKEPSDADIQHVVEQLGIKPKSVSVPKDSVQPTQNFGKEKQGTLSYLPGEIANVASGIGKGVLETARSSSKLVSGVSSVLPDVVKSAIKSVAPVATEIVKGVSKVAPTMSKLEQNVGAPENALTTTKGASEKAGFFGEKVAEMLNPESLAATASLAKKPLTLMAEKLYQSAMKPKNLVKEGKIVSSAADIVKTGLEEKVWLTKGGVERVANKIDDFENLLGSAIDHAKEQGIKISTGGLQGYLDEAKKFFQNQVDVQEAKKAVQEIDNLGVNFIKKYGSEMPIEEAQKVKVATGQLLRKYYDRLTSAGIEGQKQATRFLKEKIVEGAPIVGDINKRLSKLYQFDQALGKSQTRISNLNLLGLGTKFGAAAAGSKGALIGLLTDLADAPAIKSGVAIGLNELGKLGANGAIPLNALVALIRGKLAEQPDQPSDQVTQ